MSGVGGKYAGETCGTRGVGAVKLHQRLTEEESKNGKIWNHRDGKCLCGRKGREGESDETSHPDDSNKTRIKGTMSRWCHIQRNLTPEPLGKQHEKGGKGDSLDGPFCQRCK